MEGYNFLPDLLQSINHAIGIITRHIKSEHDLGTSIMIEEDCISQNPSTDSVTSLVQGYQV